MGYDFERVVGMNKELLKCPVCHDLAEDVVQLSCCQNYFCRKCIADCLSLSGNQNSTTTGICPLDRSRITPRKVSKAPRIVRLILDGLTIKCKYEPYGCQEVCKLSDISQHEKCCDYRDDAMVECECGLQLSRKDKTTHSCVQYLCHKIEIQRQTIVRHEHHIKSLNCRLALISSKKRKKSLAKSLKKSKPKIKSKTNQCKRRKMMVQDIDEPFRD